MTKEEALDKIKKLFALGESSNEHESALALKRARNLMFKYCISEADIDAADESAFIEVRIEALDKVSKLYQPIYEDITTTLIHFFKGQAFTRSTYFEGLRYWALIHKDTVPFLLSAIENVFAQTESLIKRYRHPDGTFSALSKFSYGKGLTVALEAALFPISDSAALVLSNEKAKSIYWKKYPMSKMNTVSGVTNSLDHSSVSQGKLDGKTINVFKPVEKEAPKEVKCLK